ncbi:MAG TPA: radical SAM family heme chaperone HemW [Rhodocyclaceae bacterium]|nr:radical SAM family heme chaperone HemW [Rhodocyclaceae bacterium]
MRTTIPLASLPTTPPEAGAPLLKALPPLALYVHFPWCLRKCPYCDFNSHEAKGGGTDIPHAAYLAALIGDLEAALPQVWGRRLSSVFIGGGTPSLMPAKMLDALLAAIRARLPLIPDAEITLEANPGAIEAGQFEAFRDASVNRISLGIQSFNNTHLNALGRIHSADEARRAIDTALRHFDNVNLDMMYALPQQTLDEARRDIATAAACGTPHLSAYHLTLEPNTAFHHAPPPLPDDDLAADMQEMIEATLAARGFQHYETSAFAMAGHRCAHNLNYWCFGDYLGIGAGAHGKLSYPDSITRETRRRHPREYLDAAAQGDFVQQRQPVERAELPFEFMMNALRLNDGIPLGLFEERTGQSLASIGEPLLLAQRRSLLTIDNERLAPTTQGRRFLNDLLALFMEAVESREL